MIRQDDLAGTVQLHRLLPFGRAQHLALLAGGHDPAVETKDGGVFDQSDVIQLRSAQRAGGPEGGRAEGEELADVGEQQRRGHQTPTTETQRHRKIAKSL